MYVDDTLGGAHALQVAKMARDQMILSLSLSGKGSDDALPKISWFQHPKMDVQLSKDLERHSARS